MAPSNSHEDPDGGAGDEVHEDGLQPSKLILNLRPMPRRLLAHSSLWSIRIQADVAVGVCRLINAVNAVALGTGPFSVRREEEHVGDVEDVEVEEEEEAVELELVEVDKVKFSLLL